MFTYTGKYTNALITIDMIESLCYSQVIDFANNPAFTKPIAMMPDCHAGKGVPIGFTMPLTDRVIPNVIGVDIGCGMLSASSSFDFPSLTESDWYDIDTAIRMAVPLGFERHGTTQNWRPDWNGLNYTFYQFIASLGLHNITENFSWDWLENLCTKLDTTPSGIFQSLGTLGGGNHFIEIGRSQELDTHRITIHTGSRNFGLRIAEYFQTLATKENPGNATLAALRNAPQTDYLQAMFFAQQYAQENRRRIMAAICRILDTSFNDSIESVHNFIDFDDKIIRKGAIRSYVGERMIIPFNMRDGMLICEGKSNAAWNYSAPHGAGRIMSRNKAKKTLSLEEYKASMSHIFSTSVCKDTLDEAPGAYKNPELIKELILETCTVLEHVTPIYSLKASKAGGKNVQDPGQTP